METLDNVFTSLITAYQLACTITRQNFSGFTIADCTDNTQSIFENKAKFPYERIPEALRPTTKYNNRKELHFDKLNSRWRIATASKDIGRSNTVNFLHMSEAAFFEVLISDVQAAIGEALTRDAIQIMESTCNGYNEFKDLWDSGTWERKFYEWWKTPEYRLNFESHERKAAFINDVNTLTDWIYKRCKWLHEVIGLDWSQIYWYFNKHDGYLNKELIKQEYPCTIDEAFLASGNCVFDKEKIVQRKEELKLRYQLLPPKKGHFSFEWNNPTAQDEIKPDSIRWVNDLNGFVTIYEDAKSSIPYVIGGDTKGQGHDFYSGTVINNTTGNRCAVLHMQVTNSKPYTWQMYCLGKYYNNALIAIEMNFNTAPIEELERLNYPNQYVRQQYDNSSKSYLKKYGWRTDGNTRPLIIDKEIDLIENNIDLFNDITMLDECLTFVYDEDNRPDAESGKHDDILFSDMIANEVRGQQSFQMVIEDYDINWEEIPEDLQEDFNKANEKWQAYMLKSWRERGLFKYNEKKIPKSRQIDLELKEMS